MQTSTQSRCLPKKPCKCCGTNREHDSDCIVNLPGKFSETYPAWQQGREDWEKLGRASADIFMYEDTIRESYMMGLSLAKRKQLADHTDQSLKRTVSLLGERFKRDAMIAGKA